MVEPRCAQARIVRWTQEGERIMRAVRTVLLAVVMVLSLGLAVPAQAGPSNPVPIKGTFVGQELRVPAVDWESFPFVAASEFVVDGVEYTCSQPAVALFLGRKSGVLSHLGAVTRDESSCVVLLPTGPSLIDRAYEVTASNGDRLDFLPTGFVPGEVGDDGWTSFVSTAVFTGGTGRFASAAGDFTEVGRTNFSESDAPVAGSDPYVTDVTVAVSGTISYDASERADK